MKKLTDIINDRLAESNNTHHATISYRPSNKDYAMIEVMCEIYKTNKSSLFHSKISETLAELLLSSKETIPLIEKCIESHKNIDLSNSAIGILLERKTITFDSTKDNPYLKKIDLRIKNHE